MLLMFSDWLQYLQVSSSALRVSIAPELKLISVWNLTEAKTERLCQLSQPYNVRET